MKKDTLTDVIKRHIDAGKRSIDIAKELSCNPNYVRAIRSRYNRLKGIPPIRFHEGMRRKVRSLPKEERKEPPKDRLELIREAHISFIARR